MKKLILFCVMLGCGAILVFSGASPCLAHDSGNGAHEGPQTTVKDVTANNDETAIRSLLEHVQRHTDGTTTTTVDQGVASTLEYYKDAKDGGHWKSGSLYAIVTDLEGIAFFHANYPVIGKNGGSLKGIKDDNGKSVVQELLKNATELNEIVCVDYEYKSEPRVSCAYQHNDNVLGAPTKRLLIFGFDHAEDAPVTYTPCPDFTPSITAGQVMDDDTLQKFVQEGLQGYLPVLLAHARGDFSKLPNYRHCMREEPWKSGAIYMFVMTSTTTVFFNGNDPLLEDTNLNVVDEDGVNVGDEIIKTASGTGVGGFVNYKWDHPLIDGDEVREDGKSPGITPKRSYVEGFNLPLQDVVFIIGSGIYPGDYEDDGGGCAVAGPANASRSAAANLLLIVSALFLATSLRRRASGKRT